MTRVKICGITNLEDALFAVAQGADALGFVFYKGSPRYIEPEKAGGIIRALPPFVTTVGVFVDAPEVFVRDAVRLSGIRVLQFHGDETPEYCRSFGIGYIKASRVRDAGSLAALEGYHDASAFLLDAYSEKGLGGTGETFDWDAAVTAKKFGRVILAGGLTPDNVAAAVVKVKPYAVDVSSGVEASKDKKDHEAVKRFIANAKGGK